MRLFSCLLACLLLTGGCVLEDTPVDPPDGSVEAGFCGFCPAETPACNEAMQMCVQCTAENATACVDDTPTCDPDSFECVQCTASSDCDDAMAARCDTELKTCVECDRASDCEGIAGLPACSAGTCVECIPDTEDTNCGGNSCNPATFSCTGTKVGSLQTCEECVADSECGEDGSASEEHRCVEMFCPMGVEMFCAVGERFPDGEKGFCLKVFAPGECEQPYAIRISDRESLSGDPLESYCGIKEALTTCPAVRALKENVSCLGGDHSECPVGGRCENVEGLPTRCTYLCDAAQECLDAGTDPENPTPGSTCGSSGSGGEDYCGG